MASISLQVVHKSRLFAQCTVRPHCANITPIAKYFATAAGMHTVPLVHSLTPETDKCPKNCFPHKMAVCTALQGRPVPCWIQQVHNTMNLGNATV